MKVVVTVSNQSNKQVKKVKVSVVQLVEVSLGPAGHVRNSIANIESQYVCVCVCVCYQFYLLLVQVDSVPSLP